MFEVLPNEALALIGDYMCYVDIMAWRFSCSHVYYNLAPPNITKLVKKELNKHISREDEFLELLNTKKAILAGSLMVKVLYDAEWEPGDIDVFEHPEQEESKTFHECLPSLGMSQISGPGWRYSSNKERYKHTINYISPLPGKISPMKRIYETFDNDIVKIAFFAGKLYVKDWNKLIARKSYCVPSYLMWIGCYGERTFRHNDVLLKQKIKDATLAEMHSRLEKYRGRGFTLTIHRQNLSLIQKGLQHSYSLNQREQDFERLFNLLDFNKHMDEELD
nr:hypothetical protein Cduv_459 [Cedratvirus duvanny]